MRVERTPLELGKPSYDEVLRYLGYAGQELDGTMSARIERTCVRCCELAQPIAGIRSYPVRERGERWVRLDGAALVLEGEAIAAHLFDAREVVLFAVTLGAAIDRELHKLSLTDLVEQVVFDACATALVERGADAVEARVRADAAANGLYCSWRFSPGYGDLRLETQAPLLAALDGLRRLGIALTPSNLMVPTKSVTAIVGMHPTPQPGLASSCSICSLADFCELRRSGTTCRAPNGVPKMQKGA